MTGLSAARSYTLAKIFAALLLISTVVLLFSPVAFLTWGDDPWEFLKPAAFIVSFLTFLLSVVGTAFTVFFGWRKERRESEESKLRIQQLELQVAQLSARKDGSSN
jgi:hypothetical protein